MDIRPIRSEADYRAALNEVERLWQGEPGTPEGDRVEVLSTLIEAYEARHHPIAAPDLPAAPRPRRFVSRPLPGVFHAADAPAHDQPLEHFCLAALPAGGTIDRAFQADLANGAKRVASSSCSRSKIRGPDNAHSELLGSELPRGLVARGCWAGSVRRMHGMLLLRGDPCGCEARQAAFAPPANRARCRWRIGAPTARGRGLHSPGGTGLHGVRAAAGGLPQLRLPRLRGDGYR